MLRVRDLQRVHVYKELPPRRPKGDGADVPRLDLLGRISNAVFSPDAHRVVGIMVKQPDVAFMIRLKDRFVALDALHMRDDELCVRNEPANFDKAAAKRLGIDLDACIIFVGMDVRTRSGESLGYCDDATFDFRTGRAHSFSVTSSGGSRALLGVRELPASEYRGFKNGVMVFSDRAADEGLTGGMAGAAGEASALAAAKAKKATKSFDAAASTVVDKGSKALGRQLGRSKGMFGAFKDEFMRSSGLGGQTKSGGSARTGSTGKRSAKGTR